MALAVAEFLVVLAASSAPLLATASASEALKNKLVDLSPLATGLEITAPYASLPSTESPSLVRARREEAARRLAAQLRLEPPVFTEEAAALPLLNGSGDTQVVLMARSGARSHVELLSHTAGAGAWISDITAHSVRVGLGGKLRLQYAVQGGRARTARIRVSGIYRALDRTAPDAYWANFLPEIFPQGVDPPASIRYVLMSPAELERVLRSLSGVKTFGFRGRTLRFRITPSVQGITEMAVDPKGLTLPRARSLTRRFAVLPRSLTSSATGRELGCALPSGAPRPPVDTSAGAPQVLCSVSSSLSSAVTLADQNASEISPIVSLLSGAGAAVALAVAGAAGLFLVRRRLGEAALLFVRGEHVLVFAARTAVEVLLPSLVGAGAGFGLALGLTGVFAPSGSIDRGTVGSALARGAVAAALALALVVAAMSIVFVQQFDSGVRRRRWLARVPWELPLLGVAGWLLDDLVSGGGLAGSSVTGTQHLTLEVFVVPLLLVAGIAGLSARAVRTVLGRRFAGDRRLPVAVFLALRRLSAARGLLVAIVVVSAVSFGAYFYSQALSTSLRHSVTEKAYIGYGGDAQGLVDPGPIPHGLRYPLTEVEYANDAATLGSSSGTASDILAIDPTSLGSVIRWYPDWGPDPRPLLHQLDDPVAGRLPVIVTRAVPADVSTIWVQGTRLPIRIVARVSAFPGMSAGIPLIAVSRQTLERAARRKQLFDPLGQERTYIWAKGPPAQAAKELESAPVYADYVTSIRSFTRDPAVLGAGRTFSYMRLVAIAAGLLVLVGLLLYLQARQRSQAVSSALAARMGLSRRTEVLSLTLELGAIGLLAATEGGVVALLAAGPIVRHIDPLSDSPPAPALIIPLEAIVVAAISITVLVLCAGLVTSWLSRRTDIGEALRVV